MASLASQLEFGKEGICDVVSSGNTSGTLQRRYKALERTVKEEINLE